MKNFVRFGLEMDVRHDQPVFERVGAAPAWRTDGHEPSVFVDDSGRRARSVHAAGLVLASLCALWLAGLVIGVSGFSAFSIVRLHTSSRARATHTRVVRSDAVADRSAGGERETAYVERRRASCPSARAGSRAQNRTGSRARNPTAVGVVAARVVAARPSRPCSSTSGARLDPRLT
jgi:hypothetical protein